ncbi:hypothetical protein J6590_093857 [Homalodisca vitripennis]|nr:hypothetical protein J6590_093857 [Homalodisca vitripennis]
MPSGQRDMQTYRKDFYTLPPLDKTEIFASLLSWTCTIKEVPFKFQRRLTEREKETIRFVWKKVEDDYPTHGRNVFVKYR